MTEAKYEVGWSVALKECPSVGTITDAELESRPDGRGYRTKRWFYRVQWPDFPEDHGWYAEEDLVEPA